MRRVRAAHHFQDLAQQASAARLATWLFLASELMLFAGLFAVYAGARAWWPETFVEGVRRAELAIGTTNTGLLLGSSFLVALAVHSMRHARPGRAAGLLAATVVVGAVFLALKGVEWARHADEGLLPGRGAFWTLYFAMTGLHALHVLGGMALLAWVARRAARGDFGPREEEHVPLELCGLYWHFVDVLWLYLWPLFYLAR